MSRTPTTSRGGTTTRPGTARASIRQPARPRVPKPAATSLRAEMAAVLKPSPSSFTSPPRNPVATSRAGIAFAARGGTTVGSGGARQAGYVLNPRLPPHVQGKLKDLFERLGRLPRSPLPPQPPAPPSILEALRRLLGR